MNPIPSAFDLPRCNGRLAHSWVYFSMLLVGISLWPATASCQPLAAKSELRFVGPASRPQQRHANELRTIAAISEIDWKPVIRIAASWSEGFAQFQQAAHLQEHLAMQQAADPPTQGDEEIAAGSPQHDPCYVSPPLSTMSVNIASPPGALPQDLAAICRELTIPVGDDRLTCGWAGYEKHWAATGMRHRPLYFEEVNAERYGYTPGHCVQPFISAGHFLATIPALPYLMVAQPPNECTYTLGHYRPGDCVPYRWHLPRCCVGAGVVETVVIVGLIALIP